MRPTDPHHESARIVYNRLCDTLTLTPIKGDTLIADSERHTDGVTRVSFVSHEHPHHNKEYDMPATKAKAQASTTTDAQVDSLLSQMNASGAVALSVADLGARIKVLSPKVNQAEATARAAIKVMLDSADQATAEQRKDAKQAHSTARKMRLGLSKLEQEQTEAVAEAERRADVYAQREAAKASASAPIASAVKADVLFLDSNKVVGADCLSMQVTKSGIHNSFVRFFRVENTIGIRAERANGTAVDASVPAVKFLDMLDLYMWQSGKSDGRTPCQIDGISTVKASEDSRFAYCGHGHNRSGLTYFVIGTGRVNNGFDSDGKPVSERSYNTPFNVSRDAWQALGLDPDVYPI